GAAEIDVPLVDALTSYRLVAVANAGTGSFGTGEATIRTTQGLILNAGLPPLVRVGDRCRAVFNVRNATDRPLAMHAGGSVTSGADAIALPPIEVELAAGKAHELSWEQLVPNGSSQARWEVSARTPDSALGDRLRTEQRVVPVHPVRVQQATLA